jgi:hypothetical protein
MQLLIDTNAEAPHILLLAAKLLVQLAESGDPDVKLPADPKAAEPSINGPSHPIVLRDELPPSGTFGQPSSTIPPVSVTASPAPQTVTAVVTPATPSTAPAAAIPAAPAATVTADASDKNGLPWDARIHSSSKALNADGTWRTRRGLAPGVLESVTAELKGGPVGVPAGTPPAIPLPPPPVLAELTAAANAAPPPPASVPLPPSVPAAPAPGGAPVVLPGDGSVPVDFRGLMQRITPLLQNGKLTHQGVADICKANGLEGLQSLVAQPMLIPTIWACVWGAAQK